jgi:hypothetical protein
MRQTQRAAVALATALAVAAAACSRGEKRSAAGEVAHDSAAADTSTLGPPSGSPAIKDAATDSAAALNGRAQAAKDAGLTPKHGLDSLAARGAAVSANDSSRAVPGVPEMRPRPGQTTGPGGTKKRP